MLNLNRFRIKARLYSGFATVIVIGLIVAGFGAWQLGRVHGQVDHMVAVADNASRNLEVSHLVERMRRLGLRFKTLGDESAVKEFNELQVQIIDVLATAAKVTSSEERRQLYNDVSAGVIALRQNFDALVQLGTQMKADQAKLFTGGDQMAAATEKLMTAELARGAGDLDLRDPAAEVRASILLVRIANWRFLATSDLKGPALFQGNVEKAEASIAALEKKDGTHRLSAAIGSVHATLQDYAASFNALATERLRADDLFFNGFRSISSKIDEQQEAARKSLAADLAATRAATKETITGATLTQEIMAGFGGLLGIILAYVIGRSIVAPVTSMTAAMGELAAGDVTTKIPARDSKDEVGDMARAVQVFKESAIEKNRLEEAQAITQSATKLRQEEIDQLIGFFGRSVSGVFKSLSGTSANMSSTSTSLERSAETTGDQATLVLNEVEQTTMNIQAVAAATQQLSSSIGEIGRQASDSALGASTAMQQAEGVVAKVDELRRAAEQIGTVVQLINSIASQTNLLALNATIEAARAGEAGKGFAVVAGEVKALANQTAQATQDIARQVAAIQAATSDAAEAIQGISGTVRGVNDTAVAIAAAVEQQGAATQEIARSIEQVTANAASVNRSMRQVQSAVGETTGNAAEVKRTSSALSTDSEMLSVEVQEFLAALRDLGDNRQLHALDLNLAASATVGNQKIAGRVLKLSPAMVLFDGPLQATAGTLVELAIGALDRPLRGRFVDRIAAGCQIQLLLNHDHLAFMERAMARLATAS